MKIKKISLIVLFILFISNLMSCSSSNKSNVPKIKSGKNITFFVASDTHYLAKSLTDGGQAFQEFINSGDGKELNYIQEIMSSFANDIKKKKPDVLIISGDLTSNG